MFDTNLILPSCSRGLVFEEEDFQPTVYGYTLCPDVSEQRVVALLRESEEELNRKIRSRPTDSPDTGEVITGNLRNLFLK